MEFHEEMKLARLKAGLTQQQVADIMGITKSTYCGYETAKRQPDPQRIKQISKALNVSADKLLNLDIKTPCNPEPAEFAGMSDLELLKATLERLGLLTPDGDLSDEDFSLMLEFFKFIEFRASNRNHNGSK